jgi:hypothetical protein
MPTIVLSPGEKLTIQLAGCDGEFEVHFDTTEHPQQVTVKETAGLPGSEVGDALALLYCEDYSKTQESLTVAADCPAEPFPVFRDPSAPAS